MSEIDRSDLPDGTYVLWQGRTYRGDVEIDPPRTVVLYAETAEDEHFTPAGSGSWERIVPDSEVTMFELTTTCRWRGAPFAVVGRTPEGLLELLYTGRSVQEAESLGLVRGGRDVFAISLPASEVTDLRQERHDVDLGQRIR